MQGPFSNYDFGKNYTASTTTLVIPDDVTKFNLANVSASNVTKILAALDEGRQIVIRNTSSTGVTLTTTDIDTAVRGNIVLSDGASSTIISDGQSITLELNSAGVFLQVS
jgi:hypothetical protein